MTDKCCGNVELPENEKTFTISLPNSVGAHNQVSVSVDPCEDNGDSLDGTVDKNYVVIQIEQFNADPARFPKCAGSSISLEHDFVLKTNPSGYENLVTVTDISTTVPDGSTGKITKTAQATLGSLPPEEADYVIIADQDTEACDTIEPITVNKTIASASYVVSSWLGTRHE